MNLICLDRILRKYLPLKIYNLCLFIWLKTFGKILSKYKKFKLRKFKNRLVKIFSLSDIKFKILLDRKNGTVDETLFLYGFIEEEILNLIKKYSDKKDVFLDIGANIGLHSLFCSNLFKKVYSFEPIPRLYEQFKKSIEMNNIKNIEAYNYGCSDKNEQKIIYENYKNVGGSSLIDIYGSDTDKKEKIKLIRLDNFLYNKKIDFVKIDVEGYELFVLKGMKNILKKYKPKVVLEFSFFTMQQIDKKMSFELLEFLKKMDYDIVDVRTDTKIENFEEYMKIFNDNKKLSYLFCT